MPYRIEKLPGEDIVVHTMTNLVSFEDNAPLMAHELIGLFDSLPDIVYYINDVKGMEVSFGDMVGALAMLTEDEMPVLRHKNIREVLIVTHGGMAAVGAKALGRAQYGSTPVSVFGTVDEALSYARQSLNHHIVGSGQP
jgi:hypothetical protein